MVVTLPTIDEVAAVLGLKPRTVQRWPKKYTDAGLGEHGKWDVLAFARLAIELSRSGVSSDDDDSQDLKERRLRAECEKLEAEAFAKQLKNAAAQKRLVDVEKATQAHAEWVVGMKSWFESLVDKFEMLFPLPTRAENKQDFADEIARKLRELSEWKPDFSKIET